MAVSPLFRFGPFTFEPHTGALWRETERLPLQPQDAAVLHSLLQQAGHVVRTEALLDAVWPETDGSETGLNNRINRLRQLLGDDPKRPQYIETRPGQGYRFLGLPLGREVGAEEMPRLGRPAAAAAGLADDTFIGREPELATLHAALADATAGPGGSCCSPASPGVGKTRLAQELAAYARQRGALVLVGRCYEWLAAHVGPARARTAIARAIEGVCASGPGCTSLLAALFCIRSGDALGPFVAAQDPGPAHRCAGGAQQLASRMAAAWGSAHAAALVLWPTRQGR
jgi:AAA ATPase domain